MISFFKNLAEDLKSIYDRDPAARNWFEVILCYSGVHALIAHRFNNALWRCHLKTLARFLAQVSRWWTGIEIHPGATIGRRFFIDHGMGVVIGETTEIGDDVTLYQGAVLGGTSWSKGKRHPTLENNVVIGAHAVVLGPIIIGQDSKVGSGSVVIHDVPPHSTVIGIPGKVVHRRDENIPHAALEHGTLPDPFTEAINGLNERLKRLEEKMKSEV
ncbi:MAG: serine O-acetyltransferase [Deltaproteobacteria bacterium CG11_big_fil_rev_8_21_14_0_20_49_13]|nr:MAG: serine O-acetyltransferase [Deltaproteobacteria bacterium CG11_big_fil_rev_8_21_14_0_20_49_13]